MREILFRGKRIDDGKWMRGLPCNNIYGALSIQPITEKCCAVIRPETVGQFTGLTDKNGKKIFEWDIVHCVSRTDEANMVVIFEDGEFRMVLCERYKDYIPGCGFYAIRCFDKEVIGNIHDNPELLGGEQDGNI